MTLTVRSYSLLDIFGISRNGWLVSSPHSEAGKLKATWCKKGVGYCRVKDGYEVVVNYTSQEIQKMYYEALLSHACYCDRLIPDVSYHLKD